MKQKQPTDVEGVKNNCPNFSQCPLCYGCRSYDSSRIECSLCISNKKMNICNRQLHKTPVLEKMITKNKFDLK